MTVSAAEVIIDAGTRQITGTYTYQVPQRISQRIQVGHRVYVSFGRQYLQGFVMRLAETLPDGVSLKPILAVLDDTPLLTPEVLQLCYWLVRRYACSLMEAIHTTLPGAYKVHSKRAYRGISGDVPQDAEEATLWSALCKTPMSFEQIVGRFTADASLRLEALLASGYVEEMTSLVDSVQPKTQTVLESAASVAELSELRAQKAQRAPKQALILNALLESLANGEDNLPLRPLKLTPSNAAVRTLLNTGLLRLGEREVYRSPVGNQLIEREEGTESRVLTRLQQTAISAITSALHHPTQHMIVLHGVTGSGKTEVYIQVIRQILRRGHGAIVLVPEIVLTPQMVGRFVSHFGTQVAVLHSGLSAGERRDEWLRVRRGEAQLVIGARSAVFAPVHNLRLIVVDEEHENSYKQEETPYYDAREAAAYRAKLAQGVAVFGSATPSLQIMHEVELGHARLVTLPVRVNERPLPPVEVVDMREELREGNTSIFSRRMQQGLEDALAQGHQAMLFLNRRGYAAFMLCRECGEVMECPRCDISLTLHGQPGRQFLECHYCHFQAPVAETCPHCHEPALRPFGLGTEQVENYLQKQWSNWTVLRMDVDTTRRKGAHQALVQQFYDGQADILLGTQMIAKGLDFPNVTFVGVIAADTLLSVPDYRASERTFNLLTQVAGRAGRAKSPGKIVVQTFRPEHFAIEAAAHHDFTQFYNEERRLRETFRYPPFCELTVFKAIHPQEHVARGASRRFERELRRRFEADDITILPASADRISRIEDKFRYQVVVKYSRWDEVNKGVTEAFETVATKMRKLNGTCVLDVNAGRI